MSPFLAPRQLGVRETGGAEAIVHAIPAFLLSLTSWQAVVDLDFIIMKSRLTTANSFNTVQLCVIFIRVNIVTEIW